MKFKKILTDNKFTIGTWITISDPIIPEVLSPAKFNWMCVDLEHTSITLDQLKKIIISIENQNVIPLVRVGENNYNLIKRVMDIGANGVIVPNINNAKEAQMAIDAVKYPPMGKRGMGLYRSQSYGKSLKEYIKWNEQESVVIVQIESQEGLDNVEEIFSLDHIDAFFVGPYDLTASMGISGKFDHIKYKNALKKILKVAKKYNIAPGIHSVSSDYRDVIKYHKQGFKMIGYSIDFMFMGDNAINGTKKINEKK